MTEKNLFLRMIDAKLAGTSSDDGYHFNTNEIAARAALVEVVQWLRDRAVSRLDAAESMKSSAQKRESLKMSQMFDILADEVAALLGES